MPGTLLVIPQTHWNITCFNQLFSALRGVAPFRGFYCILHIINSVLVPVLLRCNVLPLIWFELLAALTPDTCLDGKFRTFLGFCLTPLSAWSPTPGSQLEPEWLGGLYLSKCSSSLWLLICTQSFSYCLCISVFQIYFPISLLSSRPDVQLLTWHRDLDISKAIQTPTVPTLDSHPPLLNPTPSLIFSITGNTVTIHLVQQATNRELLICVSLHPRCH